MKKILIFQAIVNTLVLIVCLLYTAGNMVDVKYNYDVPFADFNNAGRDFRSLITYYSMMIFVIVAINMFCLFMVYRKYSSNRNYPATIANSTENIELAELYS